MPSFAAGQAIGPYTILAPLGSGGMGEVWKARDTRLDRIVAIKTSQEKFNDRFEREARAVAALNHPNICQIYDVGPDYLVMEYVEGTPIAPVDSTRKMLDIAVQLSDGLAAAHAARIIHRDLKPDNALITRDGRIKILDFGLKNVAGPEPDDKTVVDVTEAGSTVGTIAYMSPEQARGEAVLTPQSDQFSLGLILYELAMGRQAFRRGSAAETMTAIIREEADPLPDTVPAPLRWIIDRLLAKEPAERYDSTRDLYRELRQIRDRLTGTMASGVTAIAEPTPHRTRTGANRKIVIAIAAAAVLASAATWSAVPSGGRGQQRFTPMEVTLENPSYAVWSPDGKAFAYTEGAPRNRRVMLRSLSSPTATPLTRAALNWMPVGWSPDGRRVYAVGVNPQGEQSPNVLFAIPTFGGEPETIVVLPDSNAVTVSADGRNLAFRRTEEKKLVVYTASPVGATPKRYSLPFEVSNYINAPPLRFAPDNSFLILAADTQGAREVWKLPYPPGSGKPEKILERLPPYGGTPSPSLFPGGRFGVVTLQESEGQPYHLWIAGLHSGKRRRATEGTNSELVQGVSPDGSKILYQQYGADYMILSASLSDASVERVVSSEIPTGMPSWARDQEKFVYVSDRSGSPAIWMRADGVDRPLITADAFPAGTTSAFMNPTLSPGADRLSYVRVDSRHVAANWISSLSGGSPVRLTNISDPIEFGGSWSPDGRQFAYISLDHSVGRLMVAKTSGETAPQQLRERVIIGQPLPEWSQDGQWILFAAGSENGGWNIVSPDGKTIHSFGDRQAMVMTFSKDSRLFYGVRIDQNHRYLFSLDIATKTEKTIGDLGQEFTPRSYFNPAIRLSVSPDGKRILFGGVRASNSLWMLEGFDRPAWTEQLREMLPW